SCNPARYTQHNGVLTINSGVSSQVSNISGVESLQGCLTLCRMRDCVALEYRPSSGLCRPVTVSKGSSESRVLGTEPGSEVFKLKNFDAVINSILSTNITLLFTSTSTGQNGSIQQTRINVTGCYRIEIAGAKGGSNYGEGKYGGRGALVAGNVSLTAGSVLSIVVGQAGGHARSEHVGSGGGGGSFVYRASDSEPLMAAGGGGGASRDNHGSFTFSF
uniref:receptor protein-tyrosine kinase n=1 Tax=Macrostomum lignano TaxID=282301 RepID=A0A1I8JKJ3_9PLAT